MNIDQAKRAQLIESGYCVFKNVLDGAMLDELRRVTERLIAEVSAADAEKYKYQGSNVQVAYQDPVFAWLFAWPAALNALASLGFDAPKFWSAFMLSKPPFGPPLYWHQDWWAWEEPISLRDLPAQVFLMYYLTDTHRENGCLRVIPGTHRKRIKLHGMLHEAHTEATQTAPLDAPEFMQHPDEVDVPVQAGDLVLGDARVLHSAHQNKTDKHRTLLTLWYFPDFDAMPDSIRVRVARQKPLQPPDWWEGEVGALVEPLIPWYTGEAQPAKWNRVPDMLHDE
jgi:ectoine hydroxylase-related dioxygenase (phytanoyl-CoA dioxygenase family)